MPDAGAVHEDGLLDEVAITFPADNDAKKRKRRPVVKYNQNHDEAGRFATGTGGNKMTVEYDKGVGGYYRIKTDEAVAQSEAAIRAAHGGNLPIPVKVHVRKLGNIVGENGLRLVAWYDPAQPGVLNVNGDMAMGDSILLNGTTLTHEYGHAVEFEMIKTGKVDSGMTYIEVGGTHTIMRLAKLERNPGATDSQRVYASYLSGQSESFARAYSQWVTGRSANVDMAKQITAGQHNNEQWPEGEFKPVAEAFDNVFGAEVKKANPNHDELGRFSSGAGGSAAGDMNDVSYRGQHTAPSNDGYSKSLGQSIGEIYPSDFSSHPDYYMGHQSTWDALSKRQAADEYKAAVFIMRAQRHQEAIKAGRIPATRMGPMTKVYRAVPKDIKGNGEKVIQNGDWVTSSRAYAIQHGESNLNGEFRVVERYALAKHLYTDGNDLLEWGYDESSEIHKYNQNHDEAGRFASGTGIRMSDKKIGVRLREKDGGFTLDPQTGAEPKSGFAVSIHPERSKPINGVAKLTDSEIASKVKSYMSANSDLLSKKGNMVGAWHDPETGTAWLDVSTVVDDAKVAHKLGASHDQIAYFDISSGNSVDIDRTATSGQVQKFNTNHDDLGRFSSGTSTSVEGSVYRIGPAFEAENEFGAAGLRHTASDTFATIQQVHKLPEMTRITMTRNGVGGPGVGGSYNPRDHVLDLSPVAASPQWTMTHEYGHALDYMAFGHGRYSSVMRVTPEAKSLRQAMEGTDEFYAWSKGSNAAYWAAPQEMFARGYAQWVANKSGDKNMLEALAKRTDAWKPEHFEPISNAFDKLFASQGLT